MSRSRTLERGLAVMIAIRDSDVPLSIADLARRTDLDRAVVMRLVDTLIAERFVAEVDGSPRRLIAGERMGRVEPIEQAEQVENEVPMLESGGWDWGGWGDVDVDSNTTGTVPYPYWDDGVRIDRGPDRETVDRSIAALLSLVGNLSLDIIAAELRGGSIPAELQSDLAAARIDDLRSNREDWITSVARGIDPAAAFSEVLDSMEERGRRVVCGRFRLTPEPLESIANGFGISRERVRQLFGEYAPAIEAVASSSEAVIQRAELARRDIGDIIDVEQLPSLIRHVLPMTEFLEPEAVEPCFLLLFPEGTLSRIGGQRRWLATTHGSRWVEHVLERASRDELLLDDFLAEVHRCGTVEDIAGLMGAIGVQAEGGRVVSAKLKLADRAVFLLRREATPLRFDEIVSNLGAGDRARSLRNALLADDRVVRVDKDTFALSEWGLVEYTNVRELMRRELGRMGGEASVTELTERLTAQFDIDPGTVKAYAKAVEFVRVAPGRIRLRGVDESVIEGSRPLSSLRGCVRIEGRWSLRLEVSAHLLRGFSVTLPAGLAQHFGVRKGTTALLPTDVGGEVSVVRRGLQDNLGRLRSIAESLSLDEGDLLFVLLPERPGGTVSFRPLHRERLRRADGPLRAGLMLGADGALTRKSACEAFGLAATSRSGEVVSLLRERGEQELADLVSDVLAAGDEHPAGSSDIARVLGL